MMTDDLNLADECNPWKLRSLTIAELLEMKLPPREYILSPIVPRRGLVVLFAQRGIGKTYTALSIAYAVAAGGSALKWSAPLPRRVLYIDGEMPLEALQERLADITVGAECEPHQGPLSLSDARRQGRRSKGERNGAYRHGRHTVEAKAERRELRRSIRLLETLARLVRASDRRC